MTATGVLLDPPPPCAERRLRREQGPDQLRWIARARSLGAVLDLLPQPLVLMVPGRPHQVWHANAAARGCCTAAGPVRLAGDLLLVPERDHAASLDTALRQVLAHGPGLRQCIALHPVVDATPATLLVIEAVDFGASADLPVSQLVLIEILQQRAAEPPLERLRIEFGLTRGEAAAACRLWSAGSVEAISRDTGKSIHTIRTQLKAAMVKTGAHTQAALVGLVGRRLSD